MNGLLEDCVCMCVSSLCTHYRFWSLALIRLIHSLSWSRILARLRTKQLYWCKLYIIQFKSDPLSHLYKQIPLHLDRNRILSTLPWILSTMYKISPHLRLFSMFMKYSLLKGGPYTSWESCNLFSYLCKDNLRSWCEGAHFPLQNTDTCLVNRWIAQRHGHFCLFWITNTLYYGPDWPSDTSVPHLLLNREVTL